MIKADVPARSQATLVCRIHHKVGRQVPSPTLGEVELENISADVIEIEVCMNPLQYFDLIITDLSGSPFFTSPYGNIFSPLGESYIFRLAPGQKHTHNIGLLGNLASEQQRRPGRYKVRGIYEYKALKAVSEPLVVAIP
jgi:hypothetical protein